MFTVQCDAAGVEVMLGNRDVLAIRNVDDGILVAYRCWCGAQGVLHTGSGVEDRSGHVPESISA